MYETVETIFHALVSYAILLLELIGVIIIVYAAVRSLIGLFRRDVRAPLKLAQGIALALEFKMGGEVLRTVLVREWSELAILGAIIILRAGLMLLIHWEIKYEEAHAALAEQETPPKP